MGRGYGFGEGILLLLVFAIVGFMAIITGIGYFLYKLF